jgi:hypothetical protein
MEHNKPELADTVLGWVEYLLGAALIYFALLSIASV